MAAAPQARRRRRSRTGCNDSARPRPGGHRPTGGTPNRAAATPAGDPRAAGPCRALPNVFAPNSVIAKSRFWYYMSMLNRVKKANGEILQINEVCEKKPSSVQTYGIWMRYDSRTGHHNMYREYRDVSVNGAVSKMYQDVASRHRSRFSNVQIVRTATVPTKLMRGGAKALRLSQYMENKCAFPLHHRVMRPSSKAFKKTFVAKRPRTNFNF